MTIVLLTCTLSLAVLKAECSSCVAKALSSAAFMPLCLRVLCVTGVRASWFGRNLDGVYAGLLMELIDRSKRLVWPLFGGLEADMLKLRSGFGCALAKGDEDTFGDSSGCKKIAIAVVLTVQKI